ncbi:MAG: Blue-light-activated histidine kinase 2 [Spirochaetes bacterium ADurb.Bin218]|nr:MAG: Blue-light-activated histidine kinase 2 [Spirochaetes bacterium ADurb.Bin218]
MKNIPSTQQDLKNKKTILLVEDEVIIAMAQAEFLSSNGYDVIQVYNGHDAMAIAVNDDSIDLILMDIDLGNGTDGTKVAEEILKKRDIPIVFLTAHAGRETVNRVKDITRYGYVVKNSGEFVLLSSIEMAFELFEAQRQTKEREIYLDVTLHSILDGVIATDEQGKILRMNRSAEQLTGWKLHGAYGRPLYDVFRVMDIKENQPDKDSEHHIINFDPQGEWRKKLILFSRSGEVFRIDKSSSPIRNENGDIRGRVIVFRDITSEYNSAKQLQDSEEKLQIIIDGVPAYIAFLDKEESYVYVNKSYAQWYGMDKDDFCGRKISDIVPPDYLERAYPYIKKALSGESVVYENYIFDKNGDRRILRVEYVPHISSGEIIGFFSMTIDITEQKSSEAQIVELLKEKELLLKEVHHRVKNNMGSIASLLYLQRDTLQDPAAIVAIQDARNRVISMMSIYEMLYRSEDYRSVPVFAYVSDLIDKISESYNPGGYIKVLKEIEDFKLDSSILFPSGIIINELLTNAFKYAFPKQASGTIHVKMIRKTARTVQISVKDNGVGLPDACEMFGKSCFGLSVVNMLVQQLKGKLSIVKNGGTEFKIDFMV